MRKNWLPLSAFALAEILGPTSGTLTLAPTFPGSRAVATRRRTGGHQAPRRSHDAQGPGSAPNRRMKCPTEQTPARRYSKPSRRRRSRLATVADHAAGETATGAAL